MRKFFIAILALLYISTSTGAMLHIHYCMGKPANWGFDHDTSKKCNKCGMKETGKGCCKDEHKFLKNDTDQKTTKSAFKTIQLIAIALPASFVEITANNNFSSVTKENSFSYPPPRSRSIAVYICNCVFLI